MCPQVSQDTRKSYRWIHDYSWTHKLIMTSEQGELARFDVKWVLIIFMIHNVLH